MTSGQFGKIAITDVIIDRATRQRRELVDIPGIAESLNRVGQIHPIVIGRDNLLVAGERRIEGARLNGWTHVTFQYTDEVDEITRRAIELEENIKRVDLPWQDEARAVLDYHEFQLSQDVEWTQEKTAAAIGYSPQTVAEKLSVARQIVAGNTMVTEAPRYSTAKGIVRRAESRKDDEALAALGVRKTLPGEDGVTIDSILCVDFNEWAPEYEGPRFNFIHCDFPYGINADKFNQGAASLHGGYSDTEDDYWRLLGTMAANLDHLCTESAHIMFWFSMDYYTETLTFFEKYTDFRMNTKPLIWTKSDNVGILPDPERGPRQIYETALFGSRGDRKIVRSTSNSIAFPSERSTHMSIKPTSMLQSFFRMFVDGNTIMLDPTAGSGGSLRAAEANSAKYVLGLERDSGFAKQANLDLQKFRLKPAVLDAV